MTEIIVILTCFAVAEVSRSLPGIIWAIRCPPDSPNYKLPPIVRRPLSPRR